MKGCPRIRQTSQLAISRAGADMVALVPPPRTRSSEEPPPFRSGRIRKKICWLKSSAMFWVAAQGPGSHTQDLGRPPLSSVISTQARRSRDPAAAARMSLAEPPPPVSGKRPSATRTGERERFPGLRTRLPVGRPPKSRTSHCTSSRSRTRALALPHELFNSQCAFRSWYRSRRDHQTAFLAMVP